MPERCKKCILPSHLPNMTLDKRGHCHYCREFEKHYAKSSAVSAEEMKKRFETLVERLRRKKGYQCLVPLSGGKDSSYVLYEIVKTYHLKALAYNFDNGFRHPQAVRNIEKMVNRLGVDFVEYRISRPEMNRLFRTFLKQAGEFCTPCNMLMGLMGVRLAKQNGIKTVMTGNSDYLSPGLTGVSPAEYYDRTYYLRVIQSRIPYRQVSSYIVPPYSFQAFQRIFGMRPTVIDMLEYLRPSLAHMNRILTEEFGWESPAGEVQHGDCVINQIKDYLMFRHWGCTEISAVYSVGVRTGEFTREEALRRAEEEECSEPPKILPQFLETIGMTEAEFEEASKKDFRQIPNIRSSRFYRMARNAVLAIESLKKKR